MPKKKNQSPKATDSPKPRKKRRWRRKLLITMGILLVLGILAEGPGARWLVHKVLTTQLEKLGMTGDLEVDGHLLSGLTLRDLSFTGSEDFRTLRIAEIGVHYNLPDLLAKKVDRLVVRELQVDLTLGPKKEDDQPKKTIADYVDLIGKAYGFANPVEVELEKIDVAMTMNSGKRLKFILAAGNHAPEAAEWTIRGFSSNALGEDGLPEQDVTITWNEQELSLTRTKILPGLIVDSVRANYPPGSSLTLAGLLEVAERKLSLAADQEGSVKIDLQEAPLDLSKIELPGDFELGGEITRLTLRTTNLLADPDDWTAEVDIDGKDLQWPKGTLGAVTIDLDVKPDALALQLDVDSHLQLKATGPHPDFGDKPVDWTNGAIINYELMASSLRGAIATGMIAGGKDAPDPATLPDGKFEAKGQLTTGGKRVVANTTVQWSLQELLYRDNSIPDLNGEANLDGDAILLTLDLTDPEPGQKLLLAAQLDLESMTYDGRAEINFPDAAWLRPLVPLKGEEWKPTGALALTWKGNGDLKEPTHEGNATVDNVSVTAPADTVAEAKVTASYKWPGSVAIPKLWVQNGLLTLEGSAALQDNRVTVTDFHIHDETGNLAKLEASLPLPAKGATFKDLLASKEALSLKLDADQLRFARLADLLPLKLPQGVAGALSADFELSGSPSKPVLDGNLIGSELEFPQTASLSKLSAKIDFDTVDDRLAATTTVSLPDRELVSLKLSLPLQIEACIEDPNLIFTLPLSGSLNIKDLNLTRFRPLVPSVENLGGIVNASLDLGNNINAPTITGTLSSTGTTMLSEDIAPPIDLSIDLKTTDGTLAATGQIKDSSGEIVALDASFPLAVEACRKDPDHFSTLPLMAHLRITKYDLKRLTFLSSHFAKLKGDLTVDLIADGTVAKPELAGTAGVQVDFCPLPNTPYREVRDTRIDLKFDGQNIELLPSKITVAGGTMELSGKVTELIGGKTFDPRFDIRLVAIQALLWRDEYMTSRGEGEFTLKGPLSGAALAGELRIIESLFFKDIDIIPLRIPVTAAPKPQLPKLDKITSSPDSLPVPPPVGNWTLDLRIRTKDPILIRGNFANGEVTANLKIGGTVSKPRPEGAVKLQDVEAGLPFSTLKVDKGTLGFRPDRPFDPVLDIKGGSQVGSHQVSIYISGPVSKPKFNLNSFPPLPENEIMALLATGTTTAGLQDTQLAQMKALQFFVDDMRRKLEAKGGNPRLESLLGLLDDVDLRLGDNDPFRGQKRTSATLELSKRWYFSAAFDQEGNSRGTIIYSIRFR